MLREYVEVFQTYLMYVSLAALAAMFVGAVLYKAMPFFEHVWRDFLHLDGMGRVITVGGIVMATMYGGSKGFWGRVQNDGADSGIGFVGIYTAVSNDVQTIGGVVTTNRIPMVSAMWTTGTVTADTDVSFRFSDTNQWTTVTKTGTTFTQDGTTNVMSFVTSEDYSSYRYWWLGSNKPAVVITSSEIDITSFSEDSQGVSISWTCTDSRATEFTVWTKKLTESTWTARATVSANSVRLTGFYVGSDTDYKVTSTFLEDGEDE